MNNPVFSIRRMSRDDKPAMREIAARIHFLVYEFPPGELGRYAAGGEAAAP